MEDIIRRIRKAGKITEMADWQIQRLIILGNSTEDIRKLISKAVDGNEGWSASFMRKSLPGNTLA